MTFTAHLPPNSERLQVVSGLASCHYDWHESTVAGLAVYMVRARRAYAPPRNASLVLLLGVLLLLLLLLVRSARTLGPGGRASIVITQLVGACSPSLGR